MRVHNKSKAECIELFASVSTYRRRKGATSTKPKLLCPVDGCQISVTCLADHLRRFHKKSIRTFGPVMPVVALQAELPHGVQESVVTIGVKTNSDVSNAALVSPDQVLVGAGVAEVTISYILNRFHSFLEHLDGGCMASPSDYVRTASKVLNAVGNDLVSITKANVGSKYVKPLQVKIESSSSDPRMKSVNRMSMKTLRNSLTHFMHFCKFLTGDWCKAFISSEVASNIDVLMKTLPGWKRSMRGKCTIEDVRRRVLDVDVALTSAHMHSYRTSDYALSAMRILKDALRRPDAVPSNADYLQCRNHMLALISFSNAHRTGVLLQFSLNDYDTGVKASRSANGDIAFTVVEHKTTTTHGEAILAVNAEEAAYLAGFIVLRTNLLVANARPFVFINHTGTKMTQADIGSALTSAFKRTTYKERVNCTKIRKAAVTAIHKQYPGQKGGVADHMCHRATTADKYYKCLVKKDNTFDSVQLIRGALTQQHVKISASEGPEPCHSGFLQVEDSASVVCDIKEEYSVNDMYVTGSQKRCFWALDNTAAVRSAFADHNSQSVRLEQVRLTLARHPQLESKLMLDLGMSGIVLLRCVRDKVRSFYRDKYGFKGKKSSGPQKKLRVLHI
jgi:hypothetical protein